jgi:hypothetical protein
VLAWGADRGDLALERRRARGRFRPRGRLPPGGDRPEPARRRELLPRSGNLYLQYWFYYAGSATAEGRVIDEAIREVSTALGNPSFHPDDWE